MPQEKQLLRKQMKDIISAMSESEKRNQSSLQSMAIMTSRYFNSAHTVLCYIPMKDEINVLPVIEKCMEYRKNICVPRIDPYTGDMDFFRLDWRNSLESQTERGSFGITEPRTSLDLFSMQDIEKNESIFAVIPGLAFTAKGGRLGRGKGFYDLYLAGLKEQCMLTGAQLYLWGACFREQLVPSLPVEPHDILMDKVSF